MTPADSLARTFAAAFAALDQLPPSDADRIAAAVVCHVRSSRPQSLMADALPLPEPEPVAAIERVLADGSTYRLANEEGCAVLILTDHEQTTAVSAMTAVESIRLRADIASVAGSKSHG